MSTNTEHDPALVSCTYGALRLPMMDARQALDMAQGYLHRAKALSRVLWCAAGSDMEPEPREVTAVADLLADLIQIADACLCVIGVQAATQKGAAGGAS